MVAIMDYSMRQLLRKRRRLRRELIARLSTGEDPVVIAPALLCFLHVRRDLGNAMQRLRAVRATLFNLGMFSTELALFLFRFKPGDVGRVAALLRIDDETFPGRHRVSSLERLCIVLRRLSSPARWVDVEAVFGRCSSALCSIFYETIEALAERCGDALCSWRGDLMNERAATNARCVQDKGGAMDNCVGFIDGTGIFVSRPGRGQQRSVFSGHKRTHMIKFQSIVTPDGLFFHLAGPMEGRRHDVTLYRDAGTDAMLEAGLLVQGVRYCVFGDKAYLLRPWVQVPVPSVAGVALGDEEEGFNVDMASVRVAVEWGYKEVKQVFPALDYKRKMKINECPVGLLNKVAVLLWNVRCCTYAGQTSEFFDCPAPSAERYLSLP